MVNKSRSGILHLDKKEQNLSLVQGTEKGEKALDIKSLRQETGYITLDPGLKNTGICTSAITYLSGEEGVLRYRGYPIEELTEKSTFIEVAYLLINNRLPDKKELAEFSDFLNIHSLIHEDMRHFFYNFPEHAHPMAILSAMIVSLSTFYPELSSVSEEENINVTTARLLSKIRTIAAFSYKKSIGEPFVYPHYEFKYCQNFLNMMFDSTVKPYQLNDSIVRALEQILIIHADHEQNCSTSAVRLVGSAQVNLYAAVSAGICALWGPLHGGANQAVIEMLEEIHKQGITIKKVIEKAKSRKHNFRLTGFGHRVYKNFDPRARLLKKVYDQLSQEIKISDPLFDIAQQLEAIALQDVYFQERHLYPNVDFYSGIILRMIGIPKNMFTVIFAIGRLPGWIAQWKEAKEDPTQKIFRPRQIYTGPKLRKYISIDKR
jgi:citrate synthase